MKAKQCGYVGPRGGECQRRQYTGAGNNDFCWVHSEQVRRGAKLFCRICNEYVNKKTGGMMPKRTFAVKPIEIGDLSALDLQEEAEFYEGTSMFNGPHPYRITIYDDQGMNPEAETAQAVFCPPFGLGHGGGAYGTEGRLGIAWGAEATWADAESVETGIEMWLNDTEAWEARN